MFFPFGRRSRHRSFSHHGEAITDTRSDLRKKVMDEFTMFGSPGYCLFLGVLGFARGMDFLSIWIATPNLVLEANPIARKLGWKGGIILNLILCVAFAFWPLPAIVIITTSLLVASRNFQSAWLMRSRGEDVYRDWHVARIEETRISLFLFCLAGNTLLTAAVGAAIILFSPAKSSLVIFAIGIRSWPGVTEGTWALPKMRAAMRRSPRCRARKGE